MFMLSTLARTHHASAASAALFDASAFALHLHIFEFSFQSNAPLWLSLDVERD